MIEKALLCKMEIFVKPGANKCCWSFFHPTTPTRSNPNWKSIHQEITRQLNNQLIFLADLNEVMTEIRRMEHAKQGVETELNVAGSNDVLTEFLKRAETEISHLNESAQITKVIISFHCPLFFK